MDAIEKKQQKQCASHGTILITKQTNRLAAQLTRHFSISSPSYSKVYYKAKRSIKKKWIAYIIEQTKFKKLHFINKIISLSF